MLSLLHPGCEKYGGLRCYSVNRLDCCGSSCQRTARRAGNCHNFTRLPCDPVAAGPRTPLHLLDVAAVWRNKKVQQTPNKQKTSTRTHALARKEGNDVWTDACAAFTMGLQKWLPKIVKRQMWHWFCFRLHLLAVRTDYEIQCSSNAVRVNSRFHGWSFLCLPSSHAPNSALNTYNYIFL